VKGDLGSKVNAVVREVLILERREPAAKCIIFSQWEEVLQIIEHGLAENDVSYVRIQGRVKYDQNLTMFRRDPSVRVLLMPLKSGAKGLNLTEANHVFFAEATCNPSIEAQAVGRIHRMGQRKRTHVHHFVVTGTVEERIFRMFRRKKLAFQAAMPAPGQDRRNVPQLSSAPAAVEQDDQAEYTTNAVRAGEKEHLSLEEIDSLLVAATAA